MFVNPVKSSLSAKSSVQTIRLVLGYDFHSVASSFQHSRSLLVISFTKINAVYLSENKNKKTGSNLTEHRTWSIKDAGGRGVSRAGAPTLRWCDWLEHRLVKILTQKIKNMSLSEGFNRNTWIFMDLTPNTFKGYIRTQPADFHAPRLCC